MSDALFFIFSGLALVFASLVIANPFSRNPVTSAMFLVLTLVCIAGLFVLLHAFFIAAIQILVYAGAVMVLFLFVIMLLDLKEEARRKFNRFGLTTGLIAVGALSGLLLWAFLKTPRRTLGVGDLEGSPRNLGHLLFSEYLLPFEVVSLILLVAMVGVILLSKRDLS